MKSLTWIFLFISVIFSFPAWAADTVLVLSSDAEEYQAVAEGFRTSFRGQITEINLENNDIKVQSVGKELAAAPPKVAVVVGDLAAQMAKWFLKDVTVIYVDAIRAAKLSLSHSGAIGIYHESDPVGQLGMLRKAFPDAKTVGVLYCPEYTQFNMDKLKEEAQKSGLTLEAAAVPSIKQVPSALSALLPKVNVLWVFQDPVVFSSESTQYVVMQSIQQKVPIFCGSQSLARGGATAAWAPDLKDAGREAAKVAQEAVSGQKPGKGEVIYPKGKLILNQKIAKIINVNLPQDLVAQAEELIK